MSLPLVTATGCPNSGSHFGGVCQGRCTRELKLYFLDPEWSGWILWDRLPTNSFFSTDFIKYEFLTFNGQALIYQIHRTKRLFPLVFQSILKQGTKLNILLHGTK